MQTIQAGLFSGSGSRCRFLSAISAAFRLNDLRSFANLAKRRRWKFLFIFFFFYECIFFLIFFPEQFIFLFFFFQYSKIFSSFLTWIQKSSFIILFLFQKQNLKYFILKWILIKKNISPMVITIFVIPPKNL